MLDWYVTSRSINHKCSPGVGRIDADQVIKNGRLSDSMCEGERIGSAKHNQRSYLRGVSKLRFICASANVATNKLVTEHHCSECIFVQCARGGWAVFSEQFGHEEWLSLEKNNLWGNEDIVGWRISCISRNDLERGCSIGRRRIISGSAEILAMSTIASMTERPREKPG
jgi:hypothetical protein